MLRLRVSRGDANARDAMVGGLSEAQTRLFALASLGKSAGREFDEARERYSAQLARMRDANLINPEQEQQHRRLTADELEARVIAARSATSARGARSLEAVPEAFRPAFDAATNTAGLTPDQAAAFAGLVAQESSWNPTARNPTSTARGLTQMLRSTAEAPGFGLPSVAYDDLDKPDVALAAGARYFKAMLDRNGGDVRLALRDYYAGPGNTNETRRAEGDRYADQVLARAGDARALVARTRADLHALGIPEERHARILALTSAAVAEQQAHDAIAMDRVRDQAQSLGGRLSAGYEVAPDSLLDLATQARRLGDARLALRLTQQAEVSGVLVASRTLPMAQLAEAHAAAHARAEREDADGNAARLAEGLRGLMESKRRALESEPLAYAARVHRSVGPLQPIDWANPDAARAGLARRLEQADLAGRLEGVAIPALTGGEVGQIKAVVNDGSLPDRVMVLRTLAEGLPPQQLRRVLQTVETGSDRARVFGVAAGLAAKGRMGLAADILRGDEFLRTNEAPALRRPEIVSATDAEVRNVFAALGSTGPQMRAALVASVRSLLATRLEAAGTLGTWGTQADVKAAVDEITNGTIEINGQFFFAPRPGMDHRQVEDLLQRLPENRLQPSDTVTDPGFARGAVTGAGVPFTRAALRSALNSGILTLHSAGDGQYFLRVAGYDIVSRGDASQRFILDLRDAYPEPAAQRELLPPATRGTMAPSMMPTFDDVDLPQRRPARGDAPAVPGAR
jgi:hypothetical protein